jgi:hypothetical protein
MRKIFTITFLVFGCIITLNAQTDNKGDFEVGASSRAGINVNFEDDGNFQGNLNPYIGYYVTNKFVVGTDINLFFNRNTFRTQLGTQGFAESSLNK